VSNITAPWWRASSISRHPGHMLAPHSEFKVVVVEEPAMQATVALKKAPDRMALVSLAMFATLVVGGVSGYAVKGLTTSAALIAPAVRVSTVGVASPATDPGIAKRALRLEVQDQNAQAGSTAPAAASHAAKRTQQ
jgi:hypothetical protein